MPPHPSDEELAFNWTLSERDIDFILTQPSRSRESLPLSRATLCLAPTRPLPRQLYPCLALPILGYLCRQLDLIPLVSLSAPGRSSTETDYQRDITTYLGWRPFDAEAHTELREWIVDQVAQHLYVEDLVEKASARLRTHRIILPGRAVFERTVNAAHAEAEHQIFERLAQPLSDETKQAIDGLLSTGHRTRSARRWPSPLQARFDPRRDHGLSPLRPVPTGSQGQAHRDLSGSGLPSSAPSTSTPLQHAGVSSSTARTSQYGRAHLRCPATQSVCANKRYALAAAFLYDAAETPPRLSGRDACAVYDGDAARGPQRLGSRNTARSGHASGGV